MIKVRRLPKPNILERKQAEWTSDLCDLRRHYYVKLEAYEHDNSLKKPKKNSANAKNSQYAHDEIKTALKLMFGKKCAYCESSVTHVSYQHVEHFRPQSIYPKLAYDWDNLLLACERCNGNKYNAKGHRFPLADGSQPEEDPLNPCSRDDTDDNLLINPCIDDPEDFFTFNQQYVVYFNQRGRVSCETYDLSREDLNDERAEVLEIAQLVIRIYKYAKECGAVDEEQEFKAALLKFLNRKRKYTAMMKAHFIEEEIYEDIAPN